MPRFPRLGRGEQDAPPESHAAEQSRPDQHAQPLTSGDPLAAPAPDAAATPATPPATAFTSGDPLSGATAAPPAAPAEPPSPAVEEPGASADAQPPAGDSPLWSAPGSSGGASDAGGAVSASSPAEAPTTVSPAVDPAAAPAPEGSAAGAVPADATPGFRERTRLRRRMRELRQLREIAFRDLGGLSFELHRFGRDRGDLVAEKLAALERIDGELRAIETALRARRPLIELREPGIAACPRCATLHGTDANFCPGCGTPLRGSVVGEAGPLRVTPVENQPGPPS